MKPGEAERAAVLAGAIMDLEVARAPLSRVAKVPGIGPLVGPILRDLATLANEVENAYRRVEVPAGKANRDEDR